MPASISIGVVDRDLMVTPRPEAVVSRSARGSRKTQAYSAPATSFSPDVRYFDEVRSSPAVTGALSRSVCHRTRIPDCTARPPRVAKDFGAVASGHPLLQKTRPSRSALTYVKARILWRAIISSFCDNFHPGPSRFNGGVAHPVRRTTHRRNHQSQWEEIDGDREQTVNWH